MWRNYAILSGIERAEPRILKEQFLNSLGKDTLKVYNGLNSQDDDNIDEIIEKLDVFCVGQTNEAIEHFKFNLRGQ